MTAVHDNKAKAYCFESYFMTIMEQAIAANFEMKLGISLGASS